MIRLTTILEDLQDSKRSTSCAFSPREARAAARILKKARIEFELEEIDDNAPLYNIDCGCNKGGFLHEMRTREECLNLLMEKVTWLTRSQAAELLDSGIKNGASTHKDSELRMTPWSAPKVETDPEAEEGAGDDITDILLEEHRANGMAGVKKLLRVSVANFSAECGGKENALNDADEEILAELAEAIQTPGYQQA